MTYLSLDTQIKTGEKLSWIFSNIFQMKKLHEYFCLKSLNCMFLFLKQLKDFNECLNGYCCLKKFKNLNRSLWQNHGTRIVEWIPFLPQKLIYIFLQFSLNMIHKSYFFFYLSGGRDRAIWAAKLNLKLFIPKL